MTALPPVKYETVLLGGGLDLITPYMNLPAGVVRSAVNFECSPTGGYTRVSGYERFDGRPSPSDALILLLTVSGNTLPLTGQTVTGATSGATGRLIAVTASYFVLTKVTGTFTGTENLTIGGSTVATQTGFVSAPTPELYARYKALAADAYRADIAAPAGSGPVRGAFILNGVTYCFRDNAGATASVLYKATTSGWAVVPFQYEVSFTAGGTAVPADGATLTKGSVTAVVRRVVLQSGAWSGSNAAGRLIIEAPSGGNFSSGVATLSGGASVTLSGAQTAITMQPGGMFETVQTNFYGQAKNVRVYGCDGKNRAWEFDGTTLVPISSGSSPDTPTHIAAHKNHLFLAVKSSAVHSAPGQPYNFSGADGASEIATGDIVTAMQVLPGNQTTGALAIFNQTNTNMLYGTSVNNWNYVPFNTGTGSLPYTVENLAQTFMFDAHGVFTMDATLNYGNFDQASLTANIRPFVNANRAYTTMATLCRTKSQYRLYFSNGNGLHLTVVDGKFIGAMPVWFPISGGVYNAWSGIDDSGNEVILLCGGNGMLYQAEKGTSFDGAAIPATITLVYNSTKMPRLLKRYRKAGVEVVGTSYFPLAFYYSFGYGKPEYQMPLPDSYGIALSAATWDTASWDGFTWDANTGGVVECEMNGTAENVALTFASNVDYADPFTLNSVTIHYTPRRGLR